MNSEYDDLESTINIPKFKILKFYLVQTPPPIYFIFLRIEKIVHVQT